MQKRERETGFEPATPSLEGLRSSQLSYSRVYASQHSSVSGLWREEDSNLRRRTPADLQSAPFGHSGISPDISSHRHGGGKLAIGFEPTTY
jgi:hypothetical protein